MLIGQYETTLTTKRRIAIPGKVRNELGSELIVGRWYENCLFLVNREGWEKMIARLTEKKEIISASVRDTDRFIKGSAFEVTPDSQGRIILPEILVEHGKLSQNVTFVGLGDRAEIWDTEMWQVKEQEINKYAGFLVENLNKI